MSSASSSGRVRALLEPLVAAAGYELETVRVQPAGRRRLLQVVVDRDGGVDLDDVARVSRSVSEALDRTDLLGATPYVLEVTSPGVDRPLTRPEHWRRAVGRLVRVTGGSGGDVVGRVTGADESGVTLAGDRGGRFGYDELGPGHVQVEFNRHGTAEP